MPEVFLDEAGVVVDYVLTEPDIHGSLSVVATEVVNAVFLGPDVDHLTGSHSEGIGEGSSHEGGETGSEEDNGQNGHAPCSP